MLPFPFVMAIFIMWLHSLQNETQTENSTSVAPAAEEMYADYKHMSIAVREMKHTDVWTLFNRLVAESYTKGDMLVGCSSRSYI